MNTCPACNKPVDPLRSRFVKVRDGKVVAYCSAEHMQESETKPTAMPASAVPAAEKRARTPASGIPAGTSPSLETGPVIEIVKDKPKKSTRSEPRIPTPPPIEDGSLDPWNAGEEGDDDAEGRKSITMPTKRGNTGLALALIAILGAGGAYLGYRFLLGNKSSGGETTTEQPPPPPPPKKTEPPPAKPVTPAEAVTKAHDVLVKQLASESPRVQRVAAAALARTGDKKAVEHLIGALGKETSDGAKLDLAYQLARAGDKKGIDALVAGLSGKRDTRLQAGRLLAQLGDQRAAPVLGNYLEVSQLRLGAAEALAPLADPAGVKALEQVRADAKASADEKARASIALGLAGRSDVIPDLQALLEDPRFNAFAASALAQLHDASGKQVLVEQLAVPSLRVEAARALRRLEPTLDASPYLPQLLAALESHKDTEQVQVAEAILLLAGDAGWSEHP